MAATPYGAGWAEGLTLAVSGHTVFCSRANGNDVAKKKSTNTAGSEREVVQTQGTARSEPPIAVEAELVDESASDDAVDSDSDSDFDEELVAEALDTDELGDDALGAEDGEYDESDLGDGERGRSTALVPLARSIELSGALSASDPLGAYMREVQRHPLLTREEEHQLALLYHETGDVDAAKKLVTSNLRLVVKIAYEYKRAYKNMMDLVQEGNIGLMQAVKRFDPHRGVKLSSYSAWWIRAYILRYILNNWRLVKLGTTQAQRKLFFNLNKERARLAAMGIEPTHGEIARRLEVSEKDVRQMDLRLSAVDASLDVPVGDSEGRQTSRLDLLPSRTAGPDALAENAQLLGMLSDHLGTFRATLAGKELEIFDKRMVAEEPLTLQQLGDEFGVSRERVRQIEARVTGRLRAFLTQCLGDENEPSTAAV